MMGDTRVHNKNRSMAVVIAMGGVVAFTAFLVGIESLSYQSSGAIEDLGDVVYLEEVPSVGVLSALSLTQNITFTNVVIVNNWHEVIAHADPGIAALIVDSGSVASVDWSWMRGEMRRGMIIGGINTTADQLVVGIDDPWLSGQNSIWHDGFGAPRGGGSAEFFSVIASWALGPSISLTSIAGNPQQFDLADGPVAERDVLYQDETLSDHPNADGIHFMVGWDKFYRILLREVVVLDAAKTEGDSAGQ